MIEELSNRITDFFIEKKVIDKGDRDIYVYGSEILISEVLCTILTLGIGIFLRHFVKTILYLSIYTLIRVYAGGYHAMSHKTCITIFNVLYISLLAFVELLFYLKISDILCVATVIAMTIIFKLAPVEDPRKMLDGYQIGKYRKKTRRRTIFCGVFLIVIYLFFPFAKDEMSYGMIGICEVALLVIIGWIKNKVLLCKSQYAKI